MSSPGVSTKATDPPRRRSIYQRPFKETLPTWTRWNCAVCALHAHGARFLPPNNSLKPSSGCFATDSAGGRECSGAWPALLS